MVSKVLSKKYKAALREVKTLVFWSKLSFVKLLQIEHSLIFLYWAIKKINPSLLGHFTADFFSAVIKNLCLGGFFYSCRKNSCRSTNNFFSHGAYPTKRNKNKKMSPKHTYNKQIAARKIKQEKRSLLSTIILNLHNSPFSERSGFFTFWYNSEYCWEVIPRKKKKIIIIKKKIPNFLAYIN